MYSIFTIYLQCHVIFSCFYITELHKCVYPSSYIITCQPHMSYHVPLLLPHSLVILSSWVLSQSKGSITNNRHRSVHYLQRLNSAIISSTHFAELHIYISCCFSLVLIDVLIDVPVPKTCTPAKCGMTPFALVVCCHLPSARGFCAHFYAVCTLPPLGCPHQLVMEDALLCNRLDVWLTAGIHFPAGEAPSKLLCDSGPQEQIVIFRGIWGMRRFAPCNHRLNKANVHHKGEDSPPPFLAGVAYRVVGPMLVGFVDAPHVFVVRPHNGWLAVGDPRRLIGRDHGDDSLVPPGRHHDLSFGQLQELPDLEIGSAYFRWNA